MRPAPPVSTRARGNANEDLAASFLEARGLVVRERNVTLAGAEIDLIAQLPGEAGAADTIVFVEVRSRRGDHAGHPSETVGPAKQRRIVRAAREQLGRHLASFVPSHPIAGSERSGPDAADAALFASTS